VKLAHTNTIVPIRRTPGIRLNATRIRDRLFTCQASIAGVLTSMALAGQAFAQTATPSTSGLSRKPMRRYMRQSRSSRPRRLRRGMPIPPQP
jgi:hypothetical protein